MQASGIRDLQARLPVLPCLFLYDLPRESIDT